MTWRRPAEWEPQERLLLAWPRDPTTWPDRVEAVRAVFVQAMQAVAPQPVTLLAHPETAADARAAVADLGHVTVVAVEHQDSWLRDYGPITTIDDEGRRRYHSFRFDAWGGKYPTLAQDDAVNGRLVDAGALPPVEAHDFVLEGGAVETDGQGTFLCTRSVVKARGQAEEDVEAVLREHLGARKVLWLDEGVTGDDTDGHIDTITRFVAPRTVVTTVEPDMDHPDHRALLVNREALHTMTDALGRSLEVIDLPLPAPVATDEGAPLPATHANFLITDHAVLVPTYGGTSDTITIDTLSALLPTREVVGLDHRDMIWGMGGIHCLSMDIPAAADVASD